MCRLTGGLVSPKLLILCLGTEARLGVQQLADVCASCNSSLDVIPDKLYDAWQPDLEHLVAHVPALHLDVGLQPHTHQSPHPSLEQRLTHGCMGSLAIVIMEAQQPCSKHMAGHPRML